MSISKLHIFQKNTDATASLKGYLYQVLKTVETWTENFSKGIDDEIYCDFEEDIFEKNQITQKAKFRQIKLYSSNFSFASEEINKCIAHFFMLHVKTDYTSYDKEFVFEANSSIAQKRGENDAKLLEEWNKNQENIDDELLGKCVSKVKAIISDYINKQVEALKGKAEEETINEALEVFNLLQDADWIEFTTRIKWKFKNVSPEVEFLQLKDNIEAIILKLPFPIDEKNIAATFGLLHSIAWEKASEKNPDDRKLTLVELKEVLLQSANDNDKWYWAVFERWKEVEAFDHFTIGEFYEVIDATRYCRQHPYLIKHDDQWKKILKIYIDKIEMADEFRRTAIYEFLWLRFRPIDFYTKPAGDLFNETEYFNSYFNEFSAFKNARELEDAQSLIHIALAACSFGITDLNIETVNNWFNQVEKTINLRLQKETNPNEICHLLENLGTHFLFLNSRKKDRKDVSQVNAPLGKILSYINQADFYDATSLSERLNKYIGFFIEIEPEENAELIEAIETFTEKLNPIVEQRHGAYKAAKVEVDKGYKYLKSNNPILLLKALNCFHKAKTLWYRQEHIEGFVLGLLNIGQLYSAIGMNLAAKYYAMGAAWMSIHNGERHLLKRIADAFGFIFHADFKQGAWMNAIISFADYINAWNELKGTPLDPDIDEMPFKAMADLALIFHSTPKFSPQLKVLIDTHIAMLGELGDDFIKPLFPGLEKDFPTDTSLKNLLENKLTDKPLNDIGKKRIICFNALGSTWEISFNNDYYTTPIAEEFCGIMQVVLAEIALSKYDYHLLKSNAIKLELEINPDNLPPEQLPSHEEMKWKVYLEYFDSTVPEKVNLHTAKSSTTLMYILESISLLPEIEFRELFQKLFSESDLAGKTLVLGSYQRMYRYIFQQQRFDSLQRQHFEYIKPSFLNLPEVSSVMKWDEVYSEKYNQEEAIQNIKNRFKNSHKCIYLTIEKLKQDEGFFDLINDLRKKGWHDWQIILSIMNFIINEKTRHQLSDKKFESEEKYREAFDKLFHELCQTDEKNCYMEFPLNSFKSKLFEFQLNNTLVIILKSYGLENKANFPNFSAVKDFLDIRFNMLNDNSNEGNLIADI